MGSGYCRTIASTLHYKGKIRNFKEDAEETGPKAGDSDREITTLQLEKTE